MILAGKKEVGEEEEYDSSIIKMEIRLLNKEKKNGRVSFLIKDSNTSFVNSLRRNIIQEVPTMAIEDIEIRQNNSILYDEIVAHRIGLIPLKTDLKSYNLPTECTCEGAGCAKCTLKLTIKAKGPGIVTAKEIQSADPNVVPVYPDMPIVKLLKGQSLELEATAMLGKGKDHMKWSPGISYYKYKPVVDITKNPDNADEVAKACPVDVFTSKSNKLAINKDKLFDCHLCGQCAELSNGAVKLNETNTDFIFFVEPFGQLDVKEMIMTAIDIMDEKLDVLVEKLKA